MVVLSLLSIAAIYVAGYFLASEVVATPVGEVRVLPSNFAYLAYYPFILVEESATGRTCGYSE